MFAAMNVYIAVRLSVLMRLCVCECGITQTFTFRRLWRLTLAVITAGSSPASSISNLGLFFWQTLIRVCKYGNGVL